MHTSSTCMRTSSGLAFNAGEERGGKERKEGNAVQPLTELDRFEKSWESAMVACSRIALEHQTRKKRFVRGDTLACLSAMKKYIKLLEDMLKETERNRDIINLSI